MQQLRRRLTYANVMSSLAVFLVLGGATAFAATQLPKNSVGTKQIKNNAVTAAKIKKNSVNSAKVKNHSLKAVDFKAGQLPQGEKGDTGPQGPQGPAGATNVVIRVGPTEEGKSEALCHSGEVAVGGGGIGETVGQLLDSSMPIGKAGEEPKEGERPIGWSAGAEELGPSSAPVTAYVVCASP